MAVRCTTWAGGSEWNRIVLDARGGGEGGIFDFFVEIIKHLPIKSTSRVGNFAKFCYITSIYLVLRMPFLRTFSATRMRSLRVFLISGNGLDKN